MAYAFVRRADGLLMCRLDAEERAVLAQVAQETSDLIRLDLGLRDEPGAVQQAAASEDPLDRLEAEFAAQDPRTPNDPAVRRLFPDASEDPAIAEEMRRFGRQDLADAKLDSLGRVMAVLDSAGPVRTEVVLDDRDAQAWLTALTDLRLVLAERLGLRSDQDAETLRMLQAIETDPALEQETAAAEDESGPGAESGDVADGRTAAEEQSASTGLVLAVYDLLTWLQESLVEAISRGLEENDGR